MQAEVRFRGSAVGRLEWLPDAYGVRIDLDCAIPCDLLLRYKAPETLCGIARNIHREGEAVRLLSLAELRDTEVDMFTTVFIGNRETVPIRGRMVTPRGYRYEGETNGRD